MTGWVVHTQCIHEDKTQARGQVWHCPGKIRGYFRIAFEERVAHILWMRGSSKAYLDYTFSRWAFFPPKMWKHSNLLFAKQEHVCTLKLQDHSVVLHFGSVLQFLYATPRWTLLGKTKKRSWQEMHSLITPTKKEKRTTISWADKHSRKSQYSVIARAFIKAPFPFRLRDLFQV